MKESYRQKPLLTLAAGVAAMALLLAGCGGGGSTTTTPDPIPVPVPPPPPPVTGIAVDTYEAGAAAVAAGEKAVMDAAKYSMMMLAGDPPVPNAPAAAESAKGESATAMANAQMVLDAETDLKDAIMAAEDAVDAAEAAKSGASPDGMTQLDNAIMSAEEDIKMAQTSLKTVQGHVKNIRGTGSDPKTPDDYAMDVAMAVGALINDDTTDGATTNTAPGAGNMPTASMSTSVGMTFAQIAGANNDVMMKPLNSNIAVPVISVDGMTTASIFAADSTLPGMDEGNVADTTTGTDPGYMGIQGAVHCLGDDCKITDGSFAGSWYFAPVATTATTATDIAAAVGTKYVTADGTTYSAEQAGTFAEFGYWLRVVSSTLTLDTYSSGTQTSPALGFDPSNDDIDNQSASYKGPVIGLSLHKTPKGDGSGFNMKSGHFDATADLTATFDNSTPRLNGDISGFQGKAVNSGWRVTLESVNLSAAGAGTGTAKGGTTDGAWSAQAYGADNKRPSGFAGTFSAHFIDGHVAGAYAANVVEE